MRGPGLPHRQLDTRPVLNIDFAPTFLAMAGLEAPPWMDGISFFPLSEQNADDGTGMDRRFLIEYHGEGSRKTVSPDCLYDDVGTLSVSVAESCSTNTSCPRLPDTTVLDYLPPKILIFPVLKKMYNVITCFYY